MSPVAEKVGDTGALSVATPLAQLSTSKYDRLIARAKQVPPVKTVVVHPCDESSLRGAVEAAEAGIITPIFVGPAAKISAAARAARLDIGRFEIVDAPHSDAAAAKAVELIRQSTAELLMKGSLHTDELMRAVTSSSTGLRTARRISHVFIMDVPTYPETLFITDAAINIFPDLDVKRDIVQNAIDLWTQVGLGTPRVAILSAVETVTSKIPSTIEAAALCKMADRGQITGGILDGPLAFDNAIDPEAARIKGIKSEVGRPRANSGSAKSGSRQYAGQEPLLHGQGGFRGYCARCAGADHSDVARRFGAVADGLLCGRGPLRARTSHHQSSARGVTPNTLLVVIAGSSSVKFRCLRPRRYPLKGQVDGMGPGSLPWSLRAGQYETWVGRRYAFSRTTT